MLLLNNPVRKTPSHHWTLRKKDNFFFKNTAKTQPSDSGRVMYIRTLNPEKTVLMISLMISLFIFLYENITGSWVVCAFSFEAPYCSQTIDFSALFFLLGADWLSLSCNLLFSTGEDSHVLKTFLTKPHNPNLVSFSLFFFF